MRATSTPDGPRVVSEPPTSCDGSRRKARPVADGLLAAIGETPLVELPRLGRLHGVRLWAKLEQCNPGGSAKDRAAARMVQDAIAEGRVTSGATIVESTSGNMGVGLAQACRALGLGLICVADVRSAPTKIAAMRALGADVRIVGDPEDASGNLLRERLALVSRLVEEVPGAVQLDQYASASNPAAHADGTMREIDDALGGDVDVVFAAVSTAGTLTGCLDLVRRRGRRTRVVAVDAVGSTLFGGVEAPRLLPGMGAGREGPLARRVAGQECIRVTDLDCVIGCRRLATTEGVLAGASSGGVLAAVAAVAGTLPSRSRCVAILADGGSAYLETVYDDAWVAERLGCDARELDRLLRAGQARTAA